MQNVIEQFVIADTIRRLELVLDPIASHEIERYLGVEAFSELRRIGERTLPKRLETAHLGPSNRPRLIFLPGVMGSYLRSDCLGAVLWLNVFKAGRFNDLALGPDGTCDLNPKYAIEPCSLHPIYTPFLSAVIQQGVFEPVAFPYDWRKSLLQSTSRLRDEIVHQYRASGGKPVHLVAHSMGGLLVRSALMQHGDVLWPIVGRIVFLGTPHYGSVALASYLKHHFWGCSLYVLLAAVLSRSTFRSMWGPLGLMPAPSGVYPGTRSTGSGDAPPSGSYRHPCVNFDPYESSNWDLGLDDQEREPLQRILNATAKLHRDLYGFHRSLDHDQAGRMAAIVGVGYRTLHGLDAEPAGERGRPIVRNLAERKAGDRDRDGDGTVLAASAALENIGRTGYIKAPHGSLPNIPMVYQATFRWLAGEKLQLVSSPQGALSEHLGPESVSEAPHLDGSGENADAVPTWDETSLTEDELMEMLGRLTRGELRAFQSILPL